MDKDNSITEKLVVFYSGLGYWERNKYVPDFEILLMKMKNMEFPMIQVDLIDWDLELITELLMFDTYYYSNDQLFFDQYILNKRFVSSNGIIYIATHKVKSKDFLSWIGIRPKYKIYFEELGIRWTFDQTKDFFYRRIRNMKEEQVKENWLKLIDRASNIRDLIEGRDE